MAIETIPLDTGDPGGPCTWAIDTDCCSTWDSLGAPLQASAAAYASLVLWAATGRRFGLCEMTVRPCGQQCTNCFQGSYWSYGTWIPYIWNGQWRNCWCGSSCCTCEPRCQVYLPGPVNSVTSVTQNGLLVPASSWRVDNNKWLVRTDGLCWPDCQDFNVDTGANTLSVVEQRGLAVPAALASATGILACEFAKACCGSACRLPQRLSTIARQGVQLTFVDIDTLLEKGLTGLTEVDQIITALNPYGLKHRLRVFSPDLPITRQTTIA